MTFAVEVQRPAEKELAQLSREVRQRIARALLRLADQPFPVGCKKLRGSMDIASGWAITGFSTLWMRPPGKWLFRHSAIAGRFIGK